MQMPTKTQPRRKSKTPAEIEMYIQRDLRRHIKDNVKMLEKSGNLLLEYIDNPPLKMFQNGLDTRRRIMNSLFGQLERLDSNIETND